MMRSRVGLVVKAAVAKRRKGGMTQKEATERRREDEEVRNVFRRWTGKKDVGNVMADEKARTDVGMKA